MLTAFVSLLVAIGVSAAATMAIKDRTYVPSPDYRPTGVALTEVAVIYYSRSGHTEAVAREVARRLNAPIVRIHADYALGFRGQRKAISDATAGRLPQITTDTMIDLRPVRRLYLASPTWMFGPAPPLWAYVEQTDLKGKEVLLIMTGNSRFKQKEVDEFSALVEAKGGHFIEHIFLRRGRIYWQQSRTELLESITPYIPKTK